MRAGLALVSPSWCAGSDASADRAAAVGHTTSVRIGFFGPVHAPLAYRTETRTTLEAQDCATLSGVDTVTICQVGVVVCAFGSAGFAFWGFRAAHDQQRQRDSQIDTNFDRLAAGQGDRSATERYVSALRNLAVESEQDSAASDVDKFISSKRDRESLKRAVNESNEKVLNWARLRIEPIKDIFQARLDGWVTDVAQKGLKIEVVRDNKAQVVIAQVGTVQSTPCQLIFPSGSRLVMYMLPARIYDGKWAGPFNLALQYEPKDRPTEGYQVSIAIGETSYELQKYRHGLYSYPEYSKMSKEDPANDRELTQAIRTAITQVMSYVVEDNSNL
jgi:hypothetical protein